MARILVERRLGGEAQWSWVAVALSGPPPSLVDLRKPGSSSLPVHHPG